MTQHRLHGLRGQAFVDECKRLFRDPGVLRQEVLDAYLIIRELNHGRFTALCLGALCVRFQIPVTVLDDWLPDITLDLEEDLRYPTGTWERLKNRGVTAKDIGVEWK